MKLVFRIGFNISYHWRDAQAYRLYYGLNIGRYRPIWRLTSLINARSSPNEIYFLFIFA